jgi:hypothetical protein
MFIFVCLFHLCLLNKTLRSKRAYTPRFFVDQTHTSKVILLHKVLLREVKGLTPSWHFLVVLACLGE